jgi:hypothetical protein
MSKIALKITYFILSLLLFVYMLVPGPTRISDFPALPKAIKSTLEGDTIQVPDVAAYFSDNYRETVIPLYQSAYADQTSLPFGPLKLNYPPEFAFTAIKDQTQSTYLEELTYPLRNSLFVNGHEPVTKDGLPRYVGAGKFEVDGEFLSTKVTLRYYSSPLWVRTTVWLGINASILILLVLTKRIFKYA